MIFLVDLQENKIAPSSETDFKSHKILERQHIEKWVEDYPQLLGEDLLVVSTEYDKFDKTEERLDVLALDTDGNLVIVELKRDDSGPKADLQAIRYAAYCSTMRLNDVAELYNARLRGLGRQLGDEKAREAILKFIQDEDFEELSDRPRIILVSRAFRPEVTASVLWLRQFGMDISCVRLSPYDMGGGRIALESVVLIPPPEAKDFMVQIERKDASYTVTQEEYIGFFTELIRRLRPQLNRDLPQPQPRSYYQIPTGVGSVHFEWGFHGRPRSSLGVELHFEKGNRDENLKLLSRLEGSISLLEAELGESVVVQKDWGKVWSRIYLTRTQGELTEELKEWAVSRMLALIRWAQPSFGDRRHPS